MSALRAFVAVAALSVAAGEAHAADAAPKKGLTILFTGDNGGEVAPCG